MIRYDLTCDRRHTFEAWFGSASAYDRAAEAGANLCPVCGSSKVDKALMTPSVNTSAARTKGREVKAPDKITLAASDPREKAVNAALRELRKKVTENADYVGNRFAEEARKIHYEETEPRGIYGEASGEEARDLVEEGIEFHSLPGLPDDKN